MNELQVFNNAEFGSLRTLLIDGEPWAVGKDIAQALGYRQPTKAVRDHVDDEDRGLSKMDTPSGEQTMVIINESGIYSLILSSKLPSAKRFKRWVTSEVLPALRKTGAYAIQGEATPPVAIPALSPVDYFQVARTLALCRREQAPAVYHVLRLAGVEIPDTPQQVTLADQYREALAELDARNARRQAETELAEELQQAIDRAREIGLSYDEIGQIVFLPGAMVRHYHAGRTYPSAAKARQCIEDINAALFDLGNIE